MKDKQEIQHLPEQFGFRSKEAEKFPEMVVCGISFTCNARCIHCPNAATGFDASLKGDERKMNWDVLRKIADECAKYPHSLVRVSSAGEILVHPEAIEMIEYILDVKKDGNVALTTNGSLLTPEKSLRLLKAGIRSIEVSMDAATKETYEKIRVGLKFDKVLHHIRELVRQRDEGGYDTRVMVSVIEQDENRAEMDFIDEFWKKEVDEVLTRKMLTFKGIIKREDDAQSSYMPKDTPCPFLWERVLIDAIGNVRGCVSDLYNASCLGNVMEKSISEIWRSETITEWRKLHLEGKKEEVAPCKGCQDLEYRSWNYNYFHALKDKK